MALDDGDTKKVPPATPPATQPLPQAPASPSLHDSLTPNERSAIADLRTGAYSMQAIANRNGFKNKSSISRLAKRYGIKPTNAGKVAAERLKLVNGEHALRENSNETHAHEPRSEPEIEAAAIAAAARLQADITIVHRGDIKSARRLVVKLVEQLGAAMNSEIAMKQVRELMKAAGIEGKEVDEKLQIMGAALSMRGRSEILRNISMAMKNLVPLERTAYGLDNEGGKPVEHVPIEERVKRWTSTEQPLPHNVTPITSAKSA